MFSREYPPRADWVRTARSDVVRFAQYCDFSAQEQSEIALAVGEACNNAVEHAESTREYSIWCEFNGSDMVIRVEDSGVGFDPSLPRPARDLMHTRGLGIFLMKNMMDKTDLDARVGSGTVLTLQKHRRAQGHAHPDNIKLSA